MPNKIIQIITKLELGGAQLIALDLCRRLVSENNEVILITNNEGALVPDAKNIKNLKIIFLPELDRDICLSRDIRCLNLLKEIIGRERPDIVHTHSSKAGILGRIAARMNKVPVIIHTIHGFAFNDYQSYFRKRFFVFFERYTARFTNKLIAVSPDVMEKGLAGKIGTREQYKVIYNGVDVNLLQNIQIDMIGKLAELEELGIVPGSPVVGMVTCFKPQKHPRGFIEMSNLVLQKIPNVQFIIIGDGVLRGELETLINNFNISKNVHLLGWRKDIPELLHIMDIFAQTSLWEGLPLSVLEAMACKKPVVVNNIDGNKDIVIDGENGFLCEPKNSAQMAEKIIYLLNNPDKAKSMGLKASQSVQKYDKGKMLDENIKLYCEQRKCYGKTH